ncbi:hypothetical protein BDD12DRAFT_811059 [Trichophaea hybrida]|nr:hypothetical protein BDD12DRAFT_811059 [Trichophaea hybrida]
MHYAPPRDLLHLQVKCFSRQSGLTRHCRVTHCCHTNSVEPEESDAGFQPGDPRLNVDPDADNIFGLDKTQRMEGFPHTGAPFDNIGHIPSFELDNWDPLSPFTTPEKWQLCRSIVDTNMGKTKLNNLLKRRLIVPGTDAKHADQLYQLIVDMDRMDGLGCGWEKG